MKKKKKYGGFVQQIMNKKLPTTVDGNPVTAQSIRDIIGKMTESAFIKGATPGVKLESSQVRLENGLWITKVNGISIIHGDGWAEDFQKRMQEELKNHKDGDVVDIPILELPMIEIPPPYERGRSDADERNDNVWNVPLWRDWLNSIDCFATDFDHDICKAVDYVVGEGHRGVLLQEKATGQHIWYYNIKMGFKKR